MGTEILWVPVQGQIIEPNPLTVRFSNLRNKFLNFPGSFCSLKEEEMSESGAPWVSRDLLTNPQVLEGERACLPGGWEAGRRGSRTSPGLGVGSLKRPRGMSYSGEMEASADAPATYKASLGAV